MAGSHLEREIKPLVLIYFQNDLLFPGQRNQLIVLWIIQFEETRKFVCERSQALIKMIVDHVAEKEESGY